MNKEDYNMILGLALVFALWGMLINLIDVIICSKRLRNPAGAIHYLLWANFFGTLMIIIILIAR